MAKITNADVRPQDGTMGHYSEHIAASKAAGARHLGEESAGNATHSILSRGAGMPSVPNPLPKPMMQPDTELAPVNPSSLPKGSIIT